MTKKALLIFAKEPVAGEVKTRLIPYLSPEAAAELYRCMLMDTLAKAATLKDVDLFLFYHGGAEAAAYFDGLTEGMNFLPQSSGDLGDRMKRAFRQVFELGYGRAAVIGTDSPDLPLAYIREAFLKLEDEHIQAVFGPSHDGGYYLLGLKQLYGELFQGIAWSSSTVLADSLAAAGKGGIGAALLASWHDVDTANDLLRPELLESANGAELTRAFLLGMMSPDHFNTSSP